MSHPKAIVPLLAWPGWSSRVRAKEVVQPPAMKADPTGSAVEDLPSLAVAHGPASYPAVSLLSGT